MIYCFLFPGFMGSASCQTIFWESSFSRVCVSLSFLSPEIDKKMKFIYKQTAAFKISNSNSFSTIHPGASGFIRFWPEEALQTDWFSEALARSWCTCCTKWTPAPTSYCSSALFWANKAQKFIVLLLRWWRPQTNAPVMEDQQWCTQCSNVSTRQLCIT